MKTYLLQGVLMLLFFNGMAQENIESVLRMIEKNNTTLSTLKAEAESAKTGNRTGLMPSNPEVEYSYLWGHPSSIGNRNDFSILQSFDFPTAYSYRSQIARLKNDQVELQYHIHRNEILHQARKMIAELTYLNALLMELQKRMDHSEQIASGYKKRFDAGDANIIDLNKANILRLNIFKDYERRYIEREFVLAGLIQSNGGKEIEYNSSEFNIPIVAAEAGQWMEQAVQNNPVIRAMEKENEIAGKQIQLEKALSLPKFHSGYMSEKIIGEHFQGITAGVSIPLWENKNKVNFARGRAEAASLRANDIRFQLSSEMNNLHEKAISLHNSLIDYEEKLADADNLPLLEKALEAGQITLSEYLLELSIYYESIDNLLEIKLDALLAYYELFRYSQDY